MAWLGSVVRDVVVALVGFSLVSAFVFVGGRLLLPAPAVSAILANLASTTVATTPGTPENPLTAARAELADMGGGGAVVVISEGRYSLPGVELLSDPCFGCSADGARSIERDLGVDIHARFSGGGAAVTLKADYVEVGVPRTEGIVLAISADGLTYNALPGQCTITLLRSEHFKYPGSIGFFLSIKSFSGEVECPALEELRGGPLASVVAVFGYQDG